jgi:hypothetical protein
VVVVEQLMVSGRRMIATHPATAAPLVIAIAGFELLEVVSSDASIGIEWEPVFER